LILCSPVLLLTPFLPGLFCAYTEMTKHALSKALGTFLTVLLESLAATLYFIRYDRYVVHRELYPARGLDTSLKL
jgi:hypothetical protein